MSVAGVHTDVLHSADDLSATGFVSLSPIKISCTEKSTLKYQQQRGMCVKILDFTLTHTWNKKFH